MKQSRLSKTLKKKLGPVGVRIWQRLYDQFLPEIMEVATIQGIVKKQDHKDWKGKVMLLADVAAHNLAILTVSDLERK